MKKFLAWLCLDSFRGRLDEQCSCLAFAGSRRLFVFIRKVSAVCRGRQAPKYLILLGNSSSFLHVFETPTQYTVLFTVFRFWNLFYSSMVFSVVAELILAFYAGYFSPRELQSIYHQDRSANWSAAKRALNRSHHFHSPRGFAAPFSEIFLRHVSSLLAALSQTNHRVQRSFV